MSSAFSIAVKNISSVVSDDELSAALPAFQTQVSRDFAPVWGLDAQLELVTKDQKTPPGAWLLLVCDNSDQAGALGYHDLSSTGTPLGKVFAKTEALYDGNWTVTFSHELLEMLADPNINLTAFDEANARLYAYEVCDAVEDDQFAYTIDGVLVSDFVYPSWFEPFGPAGAVYNYQKTVTAPFELLPGGYIGYFDIAKGSGWQQLTARTQRAATSFAPFAAPEATRYAARAHVGSRRERRRTPKSQWLRSTAG